MRAERKTAVAQSAQALADAVADGVRGIAAGEARIVIALCGGSTPQRLEKHEIVSKCLSGPPGGDWLVLGVDPGDGELVWWLDEAAAPRAETERAWRSSSA